MRDPGRYPGENDASEVDLLDHLDGFEIDLPMWLFRGGFGVDGCKDLAVQRYLMTRVATAKYCQFPDPARVVRRKRGLA